MAKRMDRKKEIRVRVEQGNFKGLSLCADPMLTRPTSSRIKEALFNILSFELEDSSFLDLFAGSGQISIEALSRACLHGVCIENHRQNCSKIRSLCAAHKIESLQILCEDVWSGLERLIIEEYKASWAFVDPPYIWWDEFRERIPELLERLSSIVQGSIIFEMSTKSLWLRNPISYPSYEVKKIYRYGDSCLVKLCRVSR